MGDSDVDVSDLEKWDPGFTETARKLLGPVGKFWFRAEVRGLDRIPPTGGALLVSNHSGGAMTPDVLVLAPAFYEALGFDRPLYTLAHYGLFKTPPRQPDRQTAWAASDSDRHPTAGVRVPVWADVDDPGEFPAAVEDRPRGA